MKAILGFPYTKDYMRKYENKLNTCIDTLKELGIKSTLKIIELDLQSHNRVMR